ncbi:hypothetical protein HZS_6527, partial [Henneguya salminicola]
MNNSPDIYHFPYKPYKIQTEFMDELYEIFNKGHIGLFQSPTGTGKTMSILCGSLKWLTDHEKSIRENIYEYCNTETKNEYDTEDPDWLKIQLNEKDKKVQDEKIIVHICNKFQSVKTILDDIDYHHYLVHDNAK